MTVSKDGMLYFSDLIITNGGIKKDKIAVKIVPPSKKLKPSIEIK